MVAAPVGQKNHLGAGSGGVSDEMQPLRITRRKKADPQSTFRSDIIAESAGQENLFDVSIVEPELSYQDFYTGGNSSFGQLHLANVSLRQDNITLMIAGSFGENKSQLIFCLYDSGNNSRRQSYVCQSQRTLDGRFA